MRVLVALVASLIGSVSAIAQAPVIPATLTAQVMLDRAGFSPGEIDGRQGRNVERALTAFQSAHGLPPTGRLDEATRTRLDARGGSQPAVVSYLITDADAAGPFTPEIPTDLIQQSRLEALGYRSLLEALAERFHASPDLLRQLNPGASFASAGETVLVPNIAVIDPLAPRPDTTPAAVIAVSKATSALTIEDREGHVLFHAPVTSGSAHDPLPIGTWMVTGVQANPPFRYNPALFWDADPAHTKATLAPGPNNPVGVVWIGISKAHYGIHGTPEPSRIGHAESHGCVRLTNWDAMRVAQWARPGTRVIFR